MQLSTYDLLAGAEGSDRAAIRTAFERLSIVPSSVALAGAEIEMVDLPRRESRLKAALAPYRERPTACSCPFNANITRWRACPS